MSDIVKGEEMASKYEKLHIYHISDEEVKDYIVKDILRIYPDAQYVEGPVFDAHKAHRNTEHAFFNVGDIVRKKEKLTATASFWINQLEENPFGKKDLKGRIVNVYYTINDYDCQNSQEPNRKVMNLDWTNFVYKKFKKEDPEYPDRAIQYVQEVLQKESTTKIGQSSL